MNRHAARTRFFVVVMSVALLGGAAGAADPPEKAAGPDPEQLDQIVKRGIRFLETKGQAPDGSFSAQAGPGVTALVATSLMRNGRRPEDPVVAKALAYVERFVYENGGIYNKPDSLYRNYETSMAIMCFKEANRDGRYDEVLARAVKYVKGIQNDEDEGHSPEDTAYGGAGYGKHKRPDLSNTAIFVEALHRAGAGGEDENIKKALAFISRTQNLEGPHNTTEHAAKIDDGGFYYTPAAGGSSKAGEAENGGLRSYGSMTYQGLKSLIYAGLDRDDPRVKAAHGWITHNYTLDTNPNMGKQGLYYYYQAFAKCLDALGEDTITDSNGVVHDWRRELVEKLAGLQRDDGSWMNDADRWLEGDPNLVTGYVLLALASARPEAN